MKRVGSRELVLLADHDSLTLRSTQPAWKCLVLGGKRKTAKSDAVLDVGLWGNLRDCIIFDTEES